MSVEKQQDEFKIKPKQNVATLEILIWSSIYLVQQTKTTTNKHLNLSYLQFIAKTHEFNIHQIK